MKLLFFAPFSAIWEHAFPEALVADALKKLGHEVVYISCGGQLDSYCLAMEAHRISVDATKNERHAICDICKRNDLLLREKFSLKGPKLTDLITTQDETVVNEMLKNQSPSTLPFFEINNIPLGKISLYQYMIRNKQLYYSTIFNKWSEVSNELRNTLYSWRAGLKLFNQYSIDRVLVYNSLYSVNRSICLLSNAFKIPSYFLHAGGNISNRLQTLIIGRDNIFFYMENLKSSWNKFSDMPSNAKSLSLVTEHFSELFKANSVFVYSSAKNKNFFSTFDYFRISSDCKVILLVMSSYDEEIAAQTIGVRKKNENSLFINQIDWLKHIIKFIELKPDVKLIIRVHPREFTNKRDGAMSQHSQELKQFFNNLPSNVYINWPSDAISLYDLAKDVDLVLSAWSSAGKELSALSIPVIVYSDELLLYPSSLNILHSDKSSYFEAITWLLINEEETLDIIKRIRNSYRWIAFEFEFSTIYIGNNFSKNLRGINRLRFKIWNRISKLFHNDQNVKIDIRRRVEEMPSIQNVSTMLEQSSVSKIDLLNPEIHSESDYRLEINSLRCELDRLYSMLFNSSNVTRSSKLEKRLNKCRKLLATY